jgi:hypothetical protein
MTSVFVVGLVECEELLQIIGIFSTLVKAKIVVNQFVLKNESYCKEIESYPKIVECQLDTAENLHFDNFVNHKNIVP